MYGLKGALIIPFGLALVLVPYSLLIGWNLLTLLLFWFVILPILTLYLPTKVSRNTNHLVEALSGLMIFYAIMVFMIYDHYQSDFFQLMILSLLINAGLVTGITLLKTAGTQIS